MVKRNKVLLLALVLLSLSIVSVAAKQTSYSLSDTDSRTANQTYTLLAQIHTLSVNTPSSIFANTTVKSTGQSRVIFQRSSSSNHRVLKEHSIRSKVSGVAMGSLSISKNPSATVTISSKEKVFKFNAMDVYYTINADIYSLWSYLENHTAKYGVYSGNIQLSEVLLSTQTQKSALE